MDEEDYNIIKEAKGNLTWKEFLLSFSAQSYKVFEKRLRDIDLEKTKIEAEIQIALKK